MRRLLAITPVALAVLLSLMAATAQAAGQQAIAFVSMRDGNPHIYRKDGTRPEHQLTHGAHSNSQPVWSPDGSSIAFTSTREGLGKIYVMNGDGSAQRRLTKGDQIETSPSWSPDGKVLAFFSCNPQTGTTDLRLVEIATGTETVITGNGKDKGSTAPVWSRDGSRLAFLGADDKDKIQVWVVERDGAGLKEISSKASNRSKAYPSLSPDGKKVAYVADFREKVDIIVTDVQTLESKNLTNSGPGVKYENTSWSPDGSRLLFGSTRDDSSLVRMDLFTMKADGTDIVNLTRHPHEDFEAKWTSDGEEVIFTSLRSGSAQIYAVELKTGKTRRVTSNKFNDMDHSVPAVRGTMGIQELAQQSS